MKTILAKTGETKIVSLTAKTADHEQAVTQQVVRKFRRHNQCFPNY